MKIICYGEQEEAAYLIAEHIISDAANFQRCRRGNREYIRLWITHMLQSLMAESGTNLA